MITDKTATRYFDRLHELMEGKATEERRLRILAELDRIERRLANPTGPRREARRRAAARQRQARRRG